MYWGLMAQQGQAPDKSLRAHTGTLLGNKMYVIGGCDRQGCWRGVCTYNTGESSSPANLTSISDGFTRRVARMGQAMSYWSKSTASEGAYYYSGWQRALCFWRRRRTHIQQRCVGLSYLSVYFVLHSGAQAHHYPEIVESKWVKPNIITPKNSWPLQRRAHTTVQYKEFLVVFGGGNGQAALNDVWALKISDPDELTWEEWKATGDVPVQKGYHTANLIGNKMVVYGGSDGNHSFSDVHVLDLGESRRSFIWDYGN